MKKISHKEIDRLIDEQERELDEILAARNVSQEGQASGQQGFWKRLWHGWSMKANA